MFVRLAEKLDRSHSAIVKKAEFLSVEKDHALLALLSDSDCTMEAWSVEKNEASVLFGLWKKT